jgi:hypothetical protein
MLNMASNPRTSKIKQLCIYLYPSSHLIHSNNMSYMNTKTLKLASALFLSVALFASSACAQQDKSKRPSPPDSASAKIGGANVSINYSSPSLKGRKIGTDLAPYGKVWRFGANEPTVFTTDKDIKVEGKTLAAGKYSVYAIPNENEWQILFSSVIPSWGITRTGEATYDPATNVLTANVKPKTSSQMYERFKIEFAKPGMLIHWGNIEVPVVMK